MSGMNCREFESEVIELARRTQVGPDTPGALTAHLDSCIRCRRLLDSQLRLSAAAGTLAANAGLLSAPAAMERALLAEVDRSLQARRGWQRRRLTYVGAALAASLAVVWFLNGRTPPQPTVASIVPVPRVSAPHIDTATVVSSNVDASKNVAKPRRARRSAAKSEPPPEQPFFAIPYTMPLAPYERAEVVHMDVPVAALIAAGMPTNMMDPAARAQTDVLFGQDGRARAIRLISVSTSN